MAHYNYDHDDNNFIIMMSQGREPSIRVKTVH